MRIKHNANLLGSELNGNEITEVELCCYVSVDKQKETKKERKKKR